MHFRNIYKKREAEHLIFSINRASLEFYDSNTYAFFNNIIKQIQECDNIRHYEPDSISQEAPFIQGDKKGNGTPDILFEGDDFILGIEDFEFDASKKTKKGSKLRIAELNAKEQLRQNRLSTTTKPTTVEALVDVNFSYEDYVNSLLIAFKNHAKNINSYRESIKRLYPSKKHIFLAFYIEDITAIGNYIATPEGTKAMCPIFIKDFLDTLSHTSGLDYIIACVQDTYTYTIHFIKNSSVNLSELYKKAYDPEKDKFISYHYKKTQRIY